MRIQRTRYLNPFMRWRWDAAGLYGYAATQRGACFKAQDAVERYRRG